MRAGRIIAIVVGAVFALASLGFLVAGGVLTIAYAVESDDGGYFDETLNRIGTATAAVTTGDIDLRTDGRQNTSRFFRGNLSQIWNYR